MSQRLLSFLTLIEGALRRSDPELARRLETTRSVDFKKGAARLVVKDSSNRDAPGSFDVQNYLLADGKTCVKIGLSWGDGSTKTIVSLFPKNEYDWAGEAAKIARIWLTSLPAVKLAMARNSGAPFSAAV
jgi:hypothetical protein